jgi:tetratricopeptide (TPR) repeat protein
LHTEAQVAARLHHPNIVSIYEVGDCDGRPYLAMEYVDGLSLQQKLAVGPLPADDAAVLLETLARAAHCAHEHGVVHRDLKPSNVLLAPASGGGSGAERPPAEPGANGIPKIADFGLARRLDADDGQTRTGAVVGTPAYMAPEQAAGSGKGAGPSVDVYALGAILYAMLTGGPPFRAATVLETLDHVRNREPAAPSSLNPAVPRDLETICLKCMEKDPARRYASAAALADDLGQFRRGDPIRARPIGPLGRCWRWGRRKPLPAGLMAALLLAVLGGLSAILVLWRQAVTSLRQEAVARREAEEHYAKLRQMLTNNVHVSASGFRPRYDPSSMPEGMLLDAEACLSHLLQKRPEDQELRALLADVLTQLGPLESPEYFERAARLWEEMPPGEARDPRYLAARASTYGYLGESYYNQGRPDLALRPLEIAFGLWVELIDEHPTPVRQDGLFNAALDVGAVLTDSGHPKEEVWRRFEELRNRPELLGGGQGTEVFFDALRVQQLCLTACRHFRARERAAGLAAARSAAVILDRYYRQVPLDRTNLLRLASPCATVCKGLRDGEAPAEALRLAERLILSLAELARQAPETHRLFAELSQSWVQAGKARWELDRVEDTLDAYRNALAAQRQACLLAPAVARYRRDLGALHLQLGRKLCELGRLDEAEACFRQRQALCPEDSARHAEALGELRKWAAQVGTDKSDLSPEKQQERQRYLDLCARLERKGI